MMVLLIEMVKPDLKSTYISVIRGQYYINGKQMKTRPTLRQHEKGTPQAWTVLAEQLKCSLCSQS